MPFTSRILDKPSFDPRCHHPQSTSVGRLFFSTPPGGIDGLFIDIDPDDDDDDDDGLNDNGITDAFDEIIFVVNPDAVDESELEDDDEEEEDEDEEEDPYTKVAASEFQDDNDRRRTDDIGSLALLGKDKLESTMMDWGGALSTLRQRVEDVDSGKAQDPSHVLFRMMSSQTPNQIIGQFVSNADPMVVQAMSGAVGSLLGGLSNPNMGVETLVKASGEKIGSLCFQLQMTGGSCWYASRCDVVVVVALTVCYSLSLSSTGYMFRNAEYVLALKDVMNLKGKSLTLSDYRDAFDRLDTDGNGYIEVSEIQTLFQEVYGKDKVPTYEISAFLEFFDQNQDGKISWEEFEKGFGAALATAKSGKGDLTMRLLEGQLHGAYDDDEDDDALDVNSNVSGTIEIELKDGKVVEVDAKEYMEQLKEEAKKLKEALRKEKTRPGQQKDIGASEAAGLIPNNAISSGMDIASYINSRQGDVKSLTEGISPEVVETMKKLVDFVLEGGDSAKAKKTLSQQEKAEMEMEIPGSALQQLALWQLVLGYRLREEEARGDYVKLLM
jgi:hypothetical protein